MLLSNLGKVSNILMIGSIPGEKIMRDINADKQQSDPCADVQKAKWKAPRLTVLRLSNTEGGPRASNMETGSKMIGTS